MRERRETKGMKKGREREKKIDEANMRNTTQER